VRPDVTVAIVGAGFGGIGMAVALRRVGIDCVIFERAGDLGGTWRDNAYPGATCDVPSHLYSFSFAPNPAWSRSFSPQSEIWDYLRRVAATYGVESCIRYDHEVTDARWNAGARVWRIETADGTSAGVTTTGRSMITARFLVSAAGPLSDPAIPAIPEFDGTVFHSARWNHSHDLTGRNVAVIGTGASAIQFIPRIQPSVARLFVFQRTAPWIIPRRDRAISAAEHWLFRHLPVTQLAARLGIYWAREGSVFGFARNPKLMKALERIALDHLHRQIADPVLRAALTPGYRIGCKRILLSSDYYPALTQPNVTLVTGAVPDLSAYPVDTVIFATGFRATEFPIARRIRGADGESLAEWLSLDDSRAGSTAFRGTTFAGFPNLFVLTGPNTGTGHTSQVFVIEAQIRYVAGAIEYAARHGATELEVREKAQRAYSHSVTGKMRSTVWTTGGCQSWYLDATGRNVTLWPDFTWKFALGTRRFDPANYKIAT
jgi:cation diffusion facilitator CzcD-associated flavoprotein CzcO